MEVWCNGGAGRKVKGTGSGGKGGPLVFESGPVLPLTKILTFLMHLYITPHSLTLNPGHLGVKLGGRKGSLV